MSKTLEQIANHLEFLGYKIEKIEPKKEGDKELVIATHAKNNNMVIFEMLPSFIMFRVNLTSERKPSTEMDTFLNDANKKFDVAKVFYDNEDDNAVLRFEAIYIGEYSKEIFGQFYDMFEKDQKRIVVLDNFSKIFLKE